MQNIVLIDNELKAEDFVMLRSKAGKLQMPIEQAEKAINNSLFVVSAICADRTVRPYLSWLKDTGKLAAAFQDSMLLWQKV